MLHGQDHLVDPYVQNCRTALCSAANSPPQPVSQISALVLCLLLIGCNSRVQHHADLGVIATFAKHLVKPEYPPSSIRERHEGVSVIKLVVTESGTVERADLLQAPDKATADASLIAARSSTFSVPSRKDGRYTMDGKLYFYFLLQPVPHVEIPTLNVK